MAAIARSLVEDAFCYDISYGDSAFLRWAKAQGARDVTDGLGMLVGQAAEAFYLWHGKRVNATAVLEQVRSSSPFTIGV